MKQAEEYVTEAVKAAHFCDTILLAVKAGAFFGKIVAVDVLAWEVEIGQTHGAYRIGLEDAFQHALDLALPHSIIQAFLDAALDAVTNGLRDETQ